MDDSYRHIISFVAQGTNCGKTYLMERLIKELIKRKRKVAAVKHAQHHSNSDLEGKDTFRFAQSGAERIILFSKDGLIMHESKSPEIDYISSISSKHMDIVLIEGFKEGPFKKIEVFNEEIYSHPMCMDQINPSYLALVSRRYIGVGIKHFCFEDIEGIATFVEISAGLTGNT